MSTQTTDDAKVLRDFGDNVAGTARLFRALGYPTPSVAEIVQAADEDEDTPAVIDQDSLRFLFKFAGGSVGELVTAIPAERVPAEISGAWYELRSISPLVEQLHEYLADPDDVALAPLF